jgi:hypothetical protein
MSWNSTNGASRSFVERSSVDRDNRDERNSSTDSRTAEVIQTWLVSRLSELLGIEPREIDVREPFASYGLVQPRWQVVGRRCAAVFGFKNEADASKAATLIKRATASGKK